MKLLAFDTAMAACSAAVFDTDAAPPLLASAFVPMERGHAEALAPMLDAMMREAKLSFTELDRIVVTKGPGTFTGVRIGLAMARGLGLALNRPVIGIDTLAAIAANEEQRPLLVACATGRAETYSALYGGGGQLIAAPAFRSRDEWLSLLPDGAVTLAGSAADLLIEASGRSDFTRSRAGDLPVAARFGLLGFKADAPDAPPEPLYLRAPDAKPQQASVTPCNDAQMLAEIHAASFETGWDRQAFEALLAMPGTRTLLARLGDRPASLLMTRRAADEAEIIVLATHPAFRRKGLARQLLNENARELATKGVTSLFIEVAVSNAPALSLYRSLGFAETGRRKDYYEHADGRREDALVMRKAIHR